MTPIAEVYYWALRKKLLDIGSILVDEFLGDLGVALQTHELLYNTHLPWSLLVSGWVEGISKDMTYLNCLFTCMMA